MFKNKGVYHSELREATEREPISITLSSDIRESRYSGKPPYVHFRVGGNASVEHTYQIENDAIRQQIEGLPQNEMLSVRATGSKEDAALEVSGANGQAPPPPAAPAPAPTQASAPRNGNGNGNGSSRPPLARSYFEALEVAHQVVAQFEKRFGHEPSEAERTIATSLWIESNRCGGSRPLTAK